MKSKALLHFGGFSVICCANVQNSQENKHLPPGPGAADRLLTFTSSMSLPQLPQPPPGHYTYGTQSGQHPSVCVCPACGVTRRQRPWRLESGTVNMPFEDNFAHEFNPRHITSIKALVLQGGLWTDTGGQPGYETSLQPPSRLTYSFSC